MLLITSMLLSALLLGPLSHSGDDEREERILVAQRVDGQISIDGVLNEETWRSAPVASNFLQYEPVEGARPSQATDVRILYGNNSVYIGAYLHDSDPNRIWRTLGRRDSFNKADWFIVFIDSYLNRKSAYTFGVNAAGVQVDGVTTRSINTSWDAVWDSAVRITSDGWIVEMRIPYSMLRFSDEDFQSWGLNFRRIIPRTSETLEWAMIPRTERQSGLVSKFGELQGLKSLRPRRNIQVTPYSVSKMTTEEGEPGRRISSGNFNYGTDLKIGVSSNIILDVTVNPDFGQVDADPAELNLSAFETFFREQRPFFVEGASTLNFELDHGSSLLYTRRIGTSEPIITASKLTGRTNGGLNFSMLGAATGKRFDPTRYYGASRLRQEIGKYSSVGGIVTLLNNSAGEFQRSALAGGLDWDLRMSDNTYKLSGYTAFTDRNFEDPDRTGAGGIAGSMAFGRVQGDWTYSSTVRAMDDRFNPNDLGRNRQNNFVRFTNTLGHQFNNGQPVGPFRRASFRVWNFQSWTWDEGVYRGMGGNLGFNLFTNSYQKIDLSVFGDYLFGGYDVNETRGLGPWAAPREISIRSSFETDSRRLWQIAPSARMKFIEGGGQDLQFKLGSKVNAGSRLSIQADVSVARSDNVSAWVSNESFKGSGTSWSVGSSSRNPSSLGPDDYVPIKGGSALGTIVESLDNYGNTDAWYLPVFGNRDTRSVDFSLRGNVTFSPYLSLQLYGQMFTARGRYDQYSLLQNRDTLSPFDAYPKRHDFAFSSFQTNTVIRWEYRPGSTLFLVWTHNRKTRSNLDAFDLGSRSPFDVGAFDQVSDTFGVFPQNVFLIKLNYLFLN